MRKGIVVALAIFLGLSLVPSAAQAGRDRDRPTAPGKYKDWGGDMDRLEILRPFRTGGYQIVVEPFDVSETDLPDKDDNTYEPVMEVLRDPAAPFAEGLDRGLGGRLRVTRDDAPGGPALVLRVKVVKMDPGSRAARYWAGFGAGAARAELSGELVDPESGATLLRFHQERRSAWGNAGGDYVTLMDRNLRQIGEDVANVLNAF